MGATGAVELDLAGGVGYGGDLALTATGDLLKVVDSATSTAATYERLARIILTNPRLLDGYGNPLGRPDDLFNPTFGSGARALVGEPLTPALIAGMQTRILAAIAADPGIATNPAPQVTIESDGTGDGFLYVTVQCYTIVGQIVTLPSLPLQPFSS